MSIWIPATIIQIKHWTDRLFSLYMTAEINTFIPGQFAKIRTRIQGKFIQRAYSYLSAPSNPNLEFYIVKITSGILTTVLNDLQINDTLMISKESYGNFILNRIPKCIDLWMIASGTGISPYLSILESFDARLNNFVNIILIHAVRYSNNLNYLPKMMKLQNIYKGQLRIQTILSQEHVPNSLYGRVPNLIENSLLEKQIGLNFNQNSHIMLCGNPQMISDTKNILNKKYGMIVHSHHVSGHITQERYW